MFSDMSQKMSLPTPFLRKLLGNCSLQMRAQIKAEDARSEKWDPTWEIDKGTSWGDEVRDPT